MFKAGQKAIALAEISRDPLGWDHTCKWLCLLKPGEEFAELMRKLWPLTILQPVGKCQISAATGIQTEA